MVILRGRTVCSMHECVNIHAGNRSFFHPGHIYVQVSLPTPVYIIIFLG